MIEYQFLAWLGKEILAPSGQAKLARFGKSFPFGSLVKTKQLAKSGIWLKISAAALTSRCVASATQNGMTLTGSEELVPLRQREQVHRAITPAERVSAAK